MKLAWAILISCVLFVGCASTDAGESPPDVAEDAASKADDGEREDIERKLTRQSTAIAWPLPDCVCTTASIW